MDPRLVERLLRIALAFGVALPAAPYLLNFPHDARYCFDVRVGDGVCLAASLLFLLIALIGGIARFPSMTAPQRSWFAPKALAAGAIWLSLPFVAGYGAEMIRRL